jgi:hypothetical protein
VSPLETDAHTEQASWGARRRNSLPEFPVVFGQFADAATSLQKEHDSLSRSLVDAVIDLAMSAARRWCHFARAQFAGGSKADQTTCIMGDANLESFYLPHTHVPHDAVEGRSLLDRGGFAMSSFVSCFSA